jgi:hypothetical protein
MTDRNEKVARSRREFLKTIGVGAGAAGAVAVTGAGEAKAEAPSLPDGSAGYRETEHVKRVYELARF